MINKYLKLATIYSRLRRLTPGQNKFLLFWLVVVLVHTSTEIADAKQPVLEPSYAWRVNSLLGDRESSTIDTIYQNYSLDFVPQQTTPAYATTGNYCAEGYNLLFMERRPISDFFFRDAISHWTPSINNTKFYNTRIPMTLLSYNFGGGKETGQDRFSTIFSANANARTQVGALIDYIYSKGSYEYQAAKDLNWGFSASYLGERYEFQGAFSHFNLVTKENGGITDDLYITDPAVVQGGNTSVNAKDIPTNLTDAHNRVKGTNLWLNNRFKLGFWREEEVNDSVTRKVLVPVTSIIWTLQYRENKHTFRNEVATQNVEFWPATYLNAAETDDFQKYWSVRNTIGLQLHEGFNKWAKASLTAFATHEMRSYDMTSMAKLPTANESELLSTLPYPDMKLAEKQNLLWVGGRLTKQQGTLLNYDAQAEIGLIGPAAGEIKVQGEITSRIPLFGDTVPVRAFGHFTNLSAPWLMEHFWSNHFMWENSFSKTRSLRLGGEIAVPWTNTHFNFTVENVQNQLYFNEFALPEQNGGSVQIVSATLRQNFHFGPFHWLNRLTYQQSSEYKVIPLPKIVVHSNAYLQFMIATLHVQFGLNCTYFTKYKGVDFQPATMIFYNQRSVDIGNYPFVDVYFNFKLSKTRFYIMMSHVNQGMTGTNWFSMPHYPMNPRRLQMGLSIDFAN